MYKGLSKRKQKRVGNRAARVGEPGRKMKRIIKANALPPTTHSLNKPCIKGYRQCKWNNNGGCLYGADQCTKKEIT
jgi:hypothetical protein